MITAAVVVAVAPAKVAKVLAMLKHVEVALERKRINIEIKYNRESKRRR